MLPEAVAPIHAGAGGASAPKAVWDEWPLDDIQHVEPKPTRISASLFWFAATAALWFARTLMVPLRLVPEWALALAMVLAGGLFAARIFTLVVGRTRRSPHSPVMLSPGKWRLSSWSRSQVFMPSSVFAPRSVEELVAVVESCARAGHKMKAAGSLHSWSGCAATDDVSVQMGCLSRVLSTDMERLTIRAEAGIMMRDLYAHMERMGLALPCLPNVDTIQLGGAISNATHGTCIETGSMCSLVEELELIVFRPPVSSGKAGVAERLTLRRNTIDAHERHLFDAAVASFGALGIIYSITLQCVTPYHSYVHEHVEPFTAMDGRFATLAKQYYSARYLWNPVSDLVFTKVQVPIRGPLVKARTRSLMTSGDLVLLKLIGWSNERAPRRWRAVRKLLGRFLKWLTQIFRADLAQAPDKGGLLTWYDAELESRLHAAFVPHPFINLEYAIPLARCDEALRELRTLFSQYPVQTFNTIVVRPVGADDAGYLAGPKNGPVMYFDLPYVADLESTGMYAAVERVCLGFGGRCSWARLIYSAPSEFLKNYPEHSRFVEAKRELDPLNVFSNAFSDQICFSLQ